MKANIQIFKASASAQIQDIGRSGFANYGIPKSGVVDPKVMKKLNKLLDNHPNDAVIEWSLLGPQLLFPQPTYIAVSQNSPHTRLNDQPIRAHEKIYVPKNSMLIMGANQHETYSYLAIDGGFLTAKVLGSRSMQTALMPDTHIHKSLDLQYDYLPERPTVLQRPSFTVPKPAPDKLVRIFKCYRGPEYSLLNESDINNLSEYFTLSTQRNRMGLLFSELLPNTLAPILSAPVLPGTIQLTPSGKLILLGRDCQTTGGYPRILWLNKKSLSGLSQLRSGIKFRLEMLDY